MRQTPHRLTQHSSSLPLLHFQGQSALRSEQGARPFFTSEEDIRGGEEVTTDSSRPCCGRAQVERCDATVLCGTSLSPREGRAEGTRQPQPGCNSTVRWNDVAWARQRTSCPPNARRPGRNWDKCLRTMPSTSPTHAGRKITRSRRAKVRQLLAPTAANVHPRR